MIRAGGIEGAVEAAVVGLHHRGAIDVVAGVITPPGFAALGFAETRAIRRRKHRH